MKTTIQEVRDFLLSAEKDGNRADWLEEAHQSWAEIKRESRVGRSFRRVMGGRRKRFPVWWSIFKIRQPLILSRLGVPICKDTTQDGNDTVGAVAAIIKERLAVNLAKAFDFFDAMIACRDDALATCFCQSRAYYEMDEVTERVKEYLTPQQDESNPDGGVFLNGDGKPVKSSEIYEDDEGFFVYHNQTIDVENERVCIEPVLYREYLVDSGVRRYNRVKQLAYIHWYSSQEFKKTFGEAAYVDHVNQSRNQPGNKDSKNQSIKVYEYWNFYTKETLWLTDFCGEFLQPKEYLTDDDEDGEERNGLYDLSGFFPNPKPLIINSPTDGFWPVTEYQQVCDLLDEIHEICTKLWETTKAINPRVLFDDNVDGLRAALKEGSPVAPIGVANLTQALVSAGGSLANVVQYIPIEKMVEAFNNYAQALENKLNHLYKLLGVSDLLQGLISDPTQRTFGERQMTEKYALNQIAELQRKMQEFVRDNYELLCEMALKNFKDASLDKYIMPQTLDLAEQEQYKSALSLLKNDNKRFRIDLETDSTIAINEEYQKAIAGEMVNIISTGLERAASIAESQPELTKPILHSLKYLIQTQRQGKMFQNEVTESIDALLEKLNQPAPAPFDKDQANFALEQQKLTADIQIRQAEIAKDERIEAFRLQQDAAISQIQAQIEALKIQTETEKNLSQLSQANQKLQADVALAREELALKRDELFLEIQKMSDKKQLEQFYAVLDEKLGIYDAQLKEAAQSIEAHKASLDLQERLATEARLQSEHELDKVSKQLEVQGQMIAMSQAQQPPNIQVVLEPPPTPKRTKKFRIKRTPDGELESVEEQSEEV
jgi:hypothetical protein